MAFSPVSDINSLLARPVKGTEHLVILRHIEVIEI